MRQHYTNARGEPAPPRAAHPIDGRSAIVHCFRKRRRPLHNAGSGALEDGPASHLAKDNNDDLHSPFPRGGMRPAALRRLRLGTRTGSRLAGAEVLPHREQPPDAGLRRHVGGQDHLSESARAAAARSARLAGGQGSDDVARALDARFIAARRIVFGIALASYLLSFFHRTAPAAIAGELTRAFAISGAILGTLAATYFYVYTLLQVPVGVLADTLGPRRILAGGSLIAGAGSLLFGLAPAWEIAAMGRTLVGVGVSVAFIAILKICALWFPAERFATLVGVTMFAGNLGAVVAGAPLAWLVANASWRVVFVALGVLSMLLAAAAWMRVRDRPEDLGFAQVRSVAASTSIHWTRALRAVLANRATWPGFFVNVGVGGSYLAFAGLWAVPFLEQTYAMPRVAAAEHASVLLLGVAVGSLAVGVISDRLRNRRLLMRICTLLYALSWLPWLAHVQWPLAATLGWFLLMGLLIPGFTLSWTIAKEVNRPEHSGIATAIVNTGVFLGTGILQPLVGWALDRGHAIDPIAAWERALLILAGAAALGAAMAWCARERPQTTVSAKA
jgi:sugar phosphate permease